VDNQPPQFASATAILLLFFHPCYLHGSHLEANTVLLKLFGFARRSLKRRASLRPSKKSSIGRYLCQDAFSTFHILWNLLHKDGTNHCSRVSSSIESIACYPRKRCFPKKNHKSFMSIVHTHNLCGLCCPSYTPTTKTIHLFQRIVTAAQIDLLFIPCDQAEGVSNWRWTSVGCVGFPSLCTASENSTD